MDILEGLRKLNVLRIIRSEETPSPVTSTNENLPNESQPETERKNLLDFLGVWDHDESHAKNTGLWSYYGAWRKDLTLDQIDAEIEKGREGWL